MILKSKRHQSKKLRDSARGQSCTLRLPCCNHNPETTVFAHISFTGGTMGGKPSDLFGCECCSDCHDFIDSRVDETWECPVSGEIDISEEKARAIQETQQRWLDEGLLKL